jgi:DNA polymerase III subunit gamma/tau
MYQALARKWRPQTLDDVLGQQAVTRTLRNALKSKRIAQSFVFAGPRGCGKTTTARILARALNCAQGPTPTPCGECEACIEIAEGRDIDVLEIDAATHTGVDNVREVIIEGLSIAPARNRYKVFLIDEVHMLSNSSFNALLKSIEEPPAHVVFMMATTALDKIPDTVLSRSQIYEFRTISAKTVSERLRYIAEQEGITVPDDALLLLARAGEGSMRDSLSAFDQVRAFSGDTLTLDDVTTVLGLVGRDLVFDMLDAVAAEDAGAAFTLVDAAIERGYDLRLLCRELARATRDLLIVSVDTGRLKDPDVASESERARVQAIGAQFSREDLLRTFDGFTRAEYDVRQSDHPRFQLEMALLKLMHLRKLLPLAELMEGGGARGLTAPLSRPAAPSAARAVPAVAARPATSTARPVAPPAARSAAPVPTRPATAASQASAAPPAAASGVASSSDESLPEGAHEQYLAGVKAGKVFFYNAVVAQAYRIDVTPARITFSFLPNQKVPRSQCEENRAWLEALGEQLFGRRIPVHIALADAATAPPAGPPAMPAAAPARPALKSPLAGRSEEELRQEALSDPTVQAMLEIFPVERTKIEEM